MTSPINRRELLRLIGLSTVGAVAGCDWKPVARATASPSLLPQRTPATGFVPDVELVLTAAPGEVNLFSGEATRVWRFTGTLVKGPPDTLLALPNSYLGPIIRLRQGQKVRIHFANQIGEDSIIHWHGLDVPVTADGHPSRVVGHGHQFVSDFEVTNRAGTYWYHPHPHMRTSAQIYGGLAGLLLVQDAEEDALGLPSGASEIFGVLQDRRFADKNQLEFPGTGMMEMSNGFLGDHMLVNGVPQPTMEVPVGWIRVRLLNASNARIYKLAWSRDVHMAVIGTDGGLLETPLYRPVITLAPGQRADVLVNLTGLAAGSEVHLETQSFAEADASVGMMGMRGMMGGRSDLPNGAPIRMMTLRTGVTPGQDFKVPKLLSTFDASWAVRADAPTRQVTLAFQQMEWLLGGRIFGMNDVASEETVAAGSTHNWELINLSEGVAMQAAHPIHLHGRQFRVVGRTGGNPGNTLRDGIIDSGWRDTVLVLPGETVRVQVTFTKNPGLYLYHCHILEHEDGGMMRNFRVI